MEFFSLPCSSERVNPFWFIPEQPSSSALVRACWLGVQKISHLWGQAVVFHLASKLNWKRKFLFFLQRKSSCCVRESDLPGAAQNASMQNSRLKSGCLARLYFQALSTLFRKCFMEINTPLKAVLLPGWDPACDPTLKHFFFGCLNHYITMVARNGSSYP